MKIWITDLGDYKELNLVPEWTNNTYSTKDVIEEWNHGNNEDAGFHWNDDLKRWECDSENFEWWEVLSEARQKTYDYFYAKTPELKSATAEYNRFYSWFCENYRNELEDEKRMTEYLSEFESL